jgi:hypothetical protein
MNYKQNNVDQNTFKNGMLFMREIITNSVHSIVNEATTHCLEKNYPK